MSSRFTIYDASAGSGKTYTIVKEYLKIVLSSSNPVKYQNILAITFTNKAANEMKERIFDTLSAISKLGNSTKEFPLLLELEGELKLSADIIIERAKRISDNILHEYSKFSISTIDKFTHRLIRTFSHDMNLPVNFDVELDTESYLQEAVDSLLSKIGKDKDISKTLIEFSIKKFREGNSWNINQGLEVVSKELFKESSSDSLKKLKNLSLEDFNDYRHKISNILFDINKGMTELGKKGNQLIQNIGVDEGFYSYKQFPVFVDQLLNKKDISAVNSSRVETAISNGLFYKKSDSKKPEAKILDQNFEALANFYSEFLDFKNKHLYRAAVCNLILKNIESISVINEIEKEVEELKNRNNVLFNAEFNAKISEELQREHVPYIYERLGDKYNYFFIDEFQDTSVLQWKNLLPLIENAISQGGRAFIVGDGKQAIYRWRSGKAEQFIDLSQGIDRYFEANKINLERNWRSHQVIIDFNNRFFSHIADKFKLDKYNKLYQEGNSQLFNHKQGGYIQIKKRDFTGELELNSDRFLYTLETIKSLLAEGYSKKDICILSRVKEPLSQLTNFLISNGVDVVSKESLLLENVPEIAFCINFLKSYNSDDDYLARFKLIEYLLENNLINAEPNEYHNYYSQLRRKSSREDFEKLLREFNIELNYIEILELPLYDAIESFARKFNLISKANIEIQFLLDFVLDFSQRKEGDINMFLQHWEKNKDKLSMIISDSVDAVNSMTIHKSKGLEFPVVILPFSNWSTTIDKRSKTWVDVEEIYEGQKIRTAFTSISKDLFEMANRSDLHSREEQENLLDSVNLLYVAFTRPVQRLYIHAGSKGKSNESTTLDLISEFIEGMEVDENGIVSFGQKQFIDVKRQVEHVRIPSRDLELINWKDRLSISLDAPKYWETSKMSEREYGNLIHTLLSKIKYADDLENVISESISQGMLDENLLNQIKDSLEAVIYHENLREYYTSNYEVMNENDIIFNSKILRPDRVLLKGKKAWLIDYKTGLRKEQHDSQIEEYKLALSSLGYEVVDGILVYLNQEVNLVRL